MSITFNCPHCKKVYRVADAKARTTMKCRVCQEKMTVPTPPTPPPDIEPTPSGTPVFRHHAPAAPPKIVTHATPFLEHIDRHVEKTIGPIAMVFHEKVSPTIHLDLLVVGPTNRRVSDKLPCGGKHFTIVTSGMSTQPMNVPRGYKGPKFMELMIALPPDWPGLHADGTFDQKTMQDERSWWPFRRLKDAARLPAEHNTFLGLGHTIPNGENAAPYADNTRLGCMLVSLPLMAPESFDLVINDNVSICFLALMPIYPEEMELKLRDGGAKLDKLMDAADLTELIDVKRPNLVKK